MSNPFNFESYPALARLGSSRDDTPMEFLPGLNMITGAQPTSQAGLAVLIGFNSEDETVRRQARAGAADAAAELRNEIEARLDDSPEVAAEKEASQRCAQVESELEDVNARLASARAAYDSAVASGLDPRKLRGPVEKAEKEAEDVTIWSNRLRAAHDTARGKVDAKGESMWREACQAKQAELAQRRAELKTRVEKAVIVFAAELLNIAEAETAFTINDSPVDELSRRLARRRR